MGANGKQEMLRITANNALILFVDGRNQSVFKASPSPLPLRLISISSEVSEVLTEASKSSLRRIVDFKKLTKSSGKQSSLLINDVEASRSIYSNAFSFHGLQQSGLLSDWDAVRVASLDRSLLGVVDRQQLLLAEVDPEIAEYCMKAQDFTGCVETMQGSPEPAYPGSEESDSDYADSEYDDEYVESDYDDEYSEDEYADGEFDDESFDDEYPEDEYADGKFDDGEFDDGSGMYPEDMGPPTAQACTGDTFGEQLACALVSALSTLLQQAFASN